MARPPRPWTVLPHGPLERLDTHLWAVTSSLPRGSIDRRMSVVRLEDGRLVCHNAVPLAGEEMRRLEGLGEPAFLVVPNGFHRLDVHAWKARYPRCRVLAPPGSAAAVARVVAVDGGLELLPRDAALEARLLDGTRAREAVLAVRGAGLSLVFGDAVMNVPHLPGLEGLVLRLLGSSGGPRVTRVARLLLVADRRAFASHLTRLAGEPGLARLVPSHGPVIAVRAPDVLRDVAARLV